MKTRPFHIALAVILMLLTFTALTSCDTNQPEPADTTRQVDSTRTMAADSTADNDSAVVHKTIAYYFHGNRRCSNCIKIENYTTEAIETAFADLIESGRLEFRVINTDEPENQHFNEDFQLYTKSVVLVNQTDGKQVRWKNLADIWNLLNDKEAFESYIRQETNYFLQDI